MAIKVIVELQAKPGRRAELKSLIESVELLAAPFRATVIRQLP